MYGDMWGYGREREIHIYIYMYVHNAGFDVYVGCSWCVSYVRLDSISLIQYYIQNENTILLFLSLSTVETGFTVWSWGFGGLGVPDILPPKDKPPSKDLLCNRNPNVELRFKAYSLCSGWGPEV